VALPLANFLDGILRCDFGNFLEGIFFLVVENFLEGIFAIDVLWGSTWSREMKMARRPESCEPFFHAETQWEGIMWEGLHSTLGIRCVS
jgi:hypothetical protein